MGIESATFLDDLISTNPLGTDTIPQGDNHLRLIKTVLKATFKNFSKAYYYPATTTSQTTDVTVATTDQNKLFPVDCSGGAITVNLPQGSTIVDGFEVEIIKTDHSLNLLTIDGYSSETINGLTTQTLWQAYQTTKLRYSSSLSAWLMKREYIPPKGEVTPWVGASAVPSGGFLFLNGQTIGDASSAGTARANADCEGLFKLLWAEYSDTVCPVSTGRGVSASADWTAHKRIGLPNLAGRTWIGLDNLGGISDAGILTASVNGANTAGQTNGEAIGNEGATVSIAQMPVHTPTGTNSAPTLNNATNVLRSASIGTAQVGTGKDALNSGTLTSATLTAVAPTFVGDSIGSGTAHANVQPSFVSAWKIKI